MVMLGYDASTFNTINDFTSWNAYFGDGSCTDSSNNTVVCPNVLGSVSTGYTTGIILTGFFVGPPIADIWGRRVPMAAGCIIVIGFTFLQTFATNFTTHVVGRAGIGIGLGLMLPVGPVYLSELAPKQIRGTMMSIWQFMYSFGAFVAYSVGLITVNKPWLGDWQWRWVLLLQASAPLFFLVCISFCPESPRWLVLKGRKKDARTVLYSIRAYEDVEQEIVEMIDVIEHERDENPGIFAAYKMIFTEWKFAKRVLMVMFINFGQQCTGQNSLNNYSSLVYRTMFSESSVALINVCNSIFGMLFTLNSTFFVDRVGRIKLFIVGAIGMAVCSALAAILYDMIPDKSSDTLGIGLVVVLFSFIFFYKPTWGATTWIYTGEVFPIVARAQAVGIASQTQNISSLILGQVFPLMFKAWSFNVFFFFGCTNLALAFVISFYPETHGVSLEQIDELFGNGKVGPIEPLENSIEASNYGRTSSDTVMELKVMGSEPGRTSSSSAMNSMMNE
ncbi:hypothetical protein HDU83_007243 [Entophlyctis luteolus]|nr:hypothetical protein HDU83_007243 [Entophlyctis luteolus]